MKSDKTNDERIVEALIVLSAEFPNTTLAQANYKAYLLVLKDLTADSVIAACHALAAAGREFYPPAGIIRQMAFDLLEDDSLPLPMECWQQLIDSWGGCGVEFHELTIKTINAMGGTRRLGQTLDKDMPYLRAQFLKVCDTYRKRVVDDRRQLPSVKEFKKLNAENVARVDAGIKKLLEGKRVDGNPGSTGEMEY